MRFFHGGFPGLAAGDKILPPDVTDTQTRLSRAANRFQGVPEHRTDVVYVSAHEHQSRVFAACYPDGALYEVQPDGEVARDPDSAYGCSWTAASATVVAVLYPRVVFAHRRFDSWMRLLTAPCEVHPAPDRLHQEARSFTGLRDAVIDG